MALLDLLVPRHLLDRLAALLLGEGVAHVDLFLNFLKGFNKVNLPHKKLEIKKYKNVGKNATFVNCHYYNGL